MVFIPLKISTSIVTALMHYLSIRTATDSEELESILLPTQIVILSLIGAK